MKRLLIGLGAATAVFFVASWIVVATVGNQSHGWKWVVGGFFWFGFLVLAAAFVVTALAALVRSRLARAAATLALLVAVFVAAAHATTSASQRFTLYSGNVASRDTPLVVEGTGAISGIGSATAKDDGPRTTVPLTLTFPKGKLFLVSHDPFRWIPNLSTCTATESSRGTYAITGGTAAYRGARGSGTFVEHGVGIGVRDARGACQQKFRVNYVVAKLTGTFRRS
jgi:hypothetical protein